MILRHTLALEVFRETSGKCENKNKFQNQEKPSNSSGLRGLCYAVACLWGPPDQDLLQEVSMPSGFLQFFLLPLITPNISSTFWSEALPMPLILFCSMDNFEGIFLLPLFLNYKGILSFKSENGKFLFKGPNSRCLWLCGGPYGLHYNYSTLWL